MKNKPTLTLSEDLVQFIIWEIRNEDKGGDKPATLTSARDSYIQAGDEVIKTCTAKGVKDPVQVGKDLISLQRIYHRGKKLEDILVLGGIDYDLEVQKLRKMI